MEYGVIKCIVSSNELLPTDEEINKEIENDLLFGEEFQKYSDREKLLMVAATKAGAKWMCDLIKRRMAK